VDAAVATNLDAIEVTVLEKVPLHVQFNAIAEGILLYEVSHEIRIRFIKDGSDYENTKQFFLQGARCLMRLFGRCQ